ncbi:type VI secretion system-associated FHA domain protein TagH [Pseudoduganella lutea]|uniref:Type VI secretion system-associated FHA domain protein TagH n=1 Tax=Pseudoduganella lutea TaxID=321985 RepID=A0A4P6L514_9BURK|nr:type VI secretion system-associated FHA domain protein TagH [Pseudoduganella lutea]QBE66699.1 type VI secretion system-associated FHA domain protein TagH [Pseudoduganella lutea]
MPISLDVHTYRGAAPVPPVGRRFDRDGVVGRAAGSDLVLDDPTKYISRAHARVEFRDGGWYLVDIGSNPSLVNGQLLGSAGQVRLTGGERIDIGDYSLVATVEPEPAPAPVPVPAPVDAEPTLREPATPPVPLFGHAADPLASAGIMNVDGLFASDFDPGADPLGLNLAPPAARPPGQGYRGAESDHAPPEQAAFVMPQPAASAAPAIPHDYDPLADLLAPAAPRAPAPWQPAPVPAQHAAPPATAVQPAPVAEQAPVQAPVQAPALEAVTELVRPPVQAPVVSAPPREPAPAPAPVPAAPVRAASAPAPAADDSRVLQALLRGLGVPELHSRHDAEQLAELAGAMLREATAGTIAALMARTLTKRESRVEMTMIAPQANNPLKFFPDASTALTNMLQGPLPGYLAPQQAFAGAFVDLRAHELAVMAGTRAALAGVLRRFDPQAIEERLQEPGVLDKVFTGNRKARMWDRMVELYDRLAVEADEDFQRLFGEAFAVAYEEQVRRLREVGK